MERSLTSDIPIHAAAPLAGDSISLRRWFALYGLALLVSGAALGVLIARQEWSGSAWARRPVETFRATGPAVKLIGFGIYLSFCCTFLPLPTGWIVAAVATREAAVAAGLSDSAAAAALATTAIVALVAAAASTVANLNDYHLFTWLLRSHRVARVRRTRTYSVAARWFARSPFFLLVVFNIIPIPVDVIRMLATTYRYPRLPFAAANFAGRFIRYAVIAFVTYWWDLGWIAVAALLALAAVLGAARVLPRLAGRLAGRRANVDAA
jgi:membrane protein YqaA with SNARE-associated domain